MQKLSFVTAWSIRLLLYSCGTLALAPLTLAQSLLSPPQYFNYFPIARPGGDILEIHTMATNSHGGTLCFEDVPAGGYYAFLDGGQLQRFDIPYQQFSNANLSFPSVLSLNSTGSIVGYSGPQGFVWLDGGIFPISYPGAITTGPHAINDNGVIAGYTVFAGEHPKGFLFDPNNGFRTISVPGGRYMSTKVLAINNLGEVTGTYLNHGNPQDSGAFILSRHGAFIYIDGHQVYDEFGNLTTLQASGITPYGINSGGEVVGLFTSGGQPYSFYYYGNRFEVLDPSREISELAGSADQVYVTGITELGQIYGFSASSPALWAGSYPLTRPKPDPRNVVFTGIAFQRNFGTPWYDDVAPTTHVGPSASNDMMLPGQVLQGDESITSANGGYTFTYQADGNLVLYRNRDQVALWASNTWLSTEGICIMQGDGNLVIYNREDKPVFDTGTWAHSGSRLVMQDDGNAVIYSPEGAALWATNTMQ